MDITSSSPVPVSQMGTFFERFDKELKEAYGQVVQLFHESVVALNSQQEAFKEAVLSQGARIERFVDDWNQIRAARASRQAARHEEISKLKELITTLETKSEEMTRKIAARKVKQKAQSTEVLEFRTRLTSYDEQGKKDYKEFDVLKTKYFAEVARCNRNLDTVNSMASIMEHRNKAVEKELIAARQAFDELRQRYTGHSHTVGDIGGERRGMSGAI